MTKITDKIPHEKIREQLSRWDFSESDFEILDALKSDSDTEITQNTLVIGNVEIAGTLRLRNECFFVVCGSVRATNFLTGYGCSVFIDSFKVIKLAQFAQSDAIAFAFADSSAKYVLSGHSMGSLTLDGAKLTAEIMDDDVKGMNGASLDCKSRDLVKDQFPDFISERDWENGDEDFWRANAAKLGLDVEKLDEEELFDLGYVAIANIADDFNVFAAAEKILAS